PRRPLDQRDARPGDAAPHDARAGWPPRRNRDHLRVHPPHRPGSLPPDDLAPDRPRDHARELRRLGIVRAEPGARARVRLVGVRRDHPDGPDLHRSRDRVRDPRRRAGQPLAQLRAQHRPPDDHRALPGAGLDDHVLRAQGSEGSGTDRSRLSSGFVSELDKETRERIEDPVSEQAEEETRLTPAEAVAQMRIKVPTRANRKLATLVDLINEDAQVKAWWHVSNVNAVKRLEINDHS